MEYPVYSDEKFYLNEQFYLQTHFVSAPMLLICFSSYTFYNTGVCCCLVS